MHRFRDRVPCARGCVRRGFSPRGTRRRGCLRLLVYLLDGAPATEPDDFDRPAVLRDAAPAGRALLLLQGPTFAIAFDRTVVSEIELPNLFANLAESGCAVARRSDLIEP